MTRSMITLTVFFIVALSGNATGFVESKCISQGKVCIDEHEREIEGFKVRRCWKDKEIFRCSSEEENNCAALEDNRGCDEIKGECKNQSITGLCNHYEKVFTCGSKANLGDGESKEIELTGSEFKVLRDEKDLSGCSAEEINQLCKMTEEKCIEGAETRNINGKEIHKECWKWDRKYQCRTNTFIDECKSLKENDKCREVRRDCIHQVEGGRCEHYAVQYECENSKQESLDCVASKFCIGDVCDEQKRNVNHNFSKALSYLGVLSEAQKDGESCGCNKEKDPNCTLQKLDTDKCSLFRGEDFKCQRITGGYNCCADSGFFIPLIGCSEKEQELQSKQHAKVCAYVGAWKGRGLIKKTFVRNRSYCCFNSTIAKIIQEQGRAQLNKGWGDIKNPDCGPLTLAEIQSIDFSKMDFSEIYSDLQEKSQKDFGAKNEKMAELLKSYKDNPDALAGIMKDKMKGFYGK